MIRCNNDILLLNYHFSLQIAGAMVDSLIINKVVLQKIMVFMIIKSVYELIMNTTSSHHGSSTSHDCAYLLRERTSQLLIIIELLLVVVRYIPWWCEVGHSMTTPAAPETIVTPLVL